MPGRSFDAFHIVKELPVLFTAFAVFAQLLGIIQGGLDINIQSGRIQLGGYPVGFLRRIAQHPGDVLDCQLGFHLVKRDDLGHPVFPILLLHVGDHFFPSVLAEINIHVGHGCPFRVQESFEQQAIPERVHVGDAQ